MTNAYFDEIIMEIVVCALLLKTDSGLRPKDKFPSLLTSAQDGIYALGKAHRRSTPSLRLLLLKPRRVGQTIATNASPAFTNFLLVLISTFPVLLTLEKKKKRKKEKKRMTVIVHFS